MIRLHRKGKDRELAPESNPLYHMLEPDAIFSVLQSSAGGITSEEATARRRVYGINDVSRFRKQPVLLQYLAHFKNLLVIILLIAAGISMLVGEMTSAAIIIAIIVASVTLDFLQEYRAGNAVELLKSRIITRATVLRDGWEQELPASELVPGDVVLLSAGDIVPADGRIIQVKDFFVNQSALTGEPFPVERHTPPSALGTVLAEAENYVFLGTSVVSGTAAVVITNTGSSTEFGRIVKTLVDRPPETEFERGLKHFSYLMAQFVFILVIFVFFVNALFRHGILESLLFAIALAVGMTPELLPMILSLNLSKGAIAMSEKGAIIKHPESIQNFGSMDVLCTDKTGTLTENRITLVNHLDTAGKESDRVLLYSYLNSVFHTGLKSPLDDAVVAFRQFDTGEYRKIDEIPFDFIRKRLTVAVVSGQETVLITKGAPEEIIRICSSIEAGSGIGPLTDEDGRKFIGISDSRNRDGFRTLAVCYRSVTGESRVLSAADERDMILLGLVTFIDPPRESATESVRMLSESGITLKILTGDNDLVARKICGMIGLPVGDVLTGAEIEVMDVETLSRVVENVTIFSRVTPVQKNQVLKALRHNGHVVGFMGDGINDAPSIREADVGISVENAVDIAKESADIVLVKSDLRILLDGIREGRKTFGNTTKYIMMGTSSNFGNMFSVAGASLFLPFLPMLPIQILLNNLLYDLSESTIPSDNIDDSYIRSPKKWDINFIRKFIWTFGPISSIFDFLTFILLLFIFHADISFFRTAWFIESICTQTLVIFVIRTEAVPFFRSRPGRPLLVSTLAVVGVACILPFTVIGEIFGFVHPPVPFYIVLVILVAGYLALVEHVKGWFYTGYMRRQVSTEP